MSNDFSERAECAESGVLPSQRGSRYSNLSVRDPAFHGMTDFMHTFPISVAPQCAVDVAIADMRRCGVRALLVVTGDDVVGLVTSYDIDRATQGGQKCARVRDVMTPWLDLPTVDWSTMQTASIGDLLEIFHGVGVMHLIVVEAGDTRAPIVRGLVSRARLERRLARAGDWDRTSPFHGRYAGYIA
jgi:CBS domain-containing protein